MNRFFPYGTLHEPLPLAAETQTLDGQPPPYDLLAARRSVDISSLTPGWRRVTIRLRLDLPTPSSEETISDLQVVLRLNCPSTNLRVGVPMIPGARLGSYIADLEIEAGALARKASLKAIVSATIDDVAGRYYGESDVWIVWVSTPEIPLLTGDLRVQWADFTSDERPGSIDPAFSQQAYYVDIEEDPPVIYLNEGIQHLRRLFDEAPRRSPSERVLREAHFHTIASAGWLGMFNASIGGIESQRDELVDWPDTEWQRQVLFTLLPRIYPDLDMDDALQAVYRDDGSPEGARMLQSRAMAAIYALLQGTAKLRRSINALEESL